jgi:hypothetical protein
MGDDSHGCWAELHDQAEVRLTLRLRTRANCHGHRVERRAVEADRRVDHSGWIINALKAIRADSGVGVHAALDICHERYNMLRESRPGELICDHDEYWKGFYS